MIASFQLRGLDCWVYIDPALDCPGEVAYGAQGEPYIVLREYDERVLFHEALHVAFAREREARAVLGDREERIVRHITRALYVAGWRRRDTDRTLAQIEHELSETAAQRDELARQLDGEGAPVRDYDYGTTGDAA